MSGHEETHSVEVQPVDKSKIQHLWKIALYLGIITSIEFVLAYVMPRGTLLIVIFISLTLVKAFYIIAEFMHLKGEVKALIWSIALPIIFLLWLILALILEGTAIFDLRY